MTNNLKTKFMLLGLFLSMVVFSGCGGVGVAVVDMDLPVDIDGNLEVTIQDQYTEIIDLKLMNKLADLTILENTVIGQQTIKISTIIIPQIGNEICLKDADGIAFLQVKILTVTSLGGNDYELLLDMPLDFAFTIDDGCLIGSTNWAVDGSVNHQFFSQGPIGLLNTTKWDITRILFICQGEGVSVSSPTPDGTSFFTMKEITNGVYLRIVDGITKNIFNAKTNNDLALRTYDVNINTEVNKNGLYTTSSRRTFAGQDKNGVTIRLGSMESDKIQLVIQDDLTDMDKCEAVIQGHVVE